MPPSSAVDDAGGGKVDVVGLLAEMDTAAQGTSGGEDADGGDDDAELANAVDDGDA